MEKTGTGYLRVRASTANGALPVEGASVIVVSDNENGEGGTVIAALRKLFYVLRQALSLIMRPFRMIYVFLREKAGLKFVGNSKVFVKSLKNAERLLRKPAGLVYNKMENKKRKNVKNVAEKSKT